MRFLDANIVAYAFYANRHVEKCQASLKGGGLTDSFALMEAFHIIEKETGSRETAKKAIKGVLSLDIVVVPVDVNLLFHALKGASESKLSIFDFVHYTCASLNGCSSILTYDRDFAGLGIPSGEP